MSGRQPLLRLEGVSRAYTMGDETVWALRHLDLSIEEGDQVNSTGRVISVPVGQGLVGRVVSWAAASTRAVSASLMPLFLP